MARGMTNDLDYLATRLHARRSRMAEGVRLDSLCRCRSVSEFCHTLYPGDDMPAADFQRRLVQDLIQELSGCLKHLDGEGSDLVGWMLVRFQLENIKVLMRGFLGRTPFEELQRHLVSLPHSLELDTPALARVESIEDFIELLPAGAPRNRLSEVAGSHRDEPRPFFLEAALDSGFFHELLARTRRITDTDSEVIKSLIFQEANIFQLMLGVRGKFHYDRPPESLRPLRVAGGGSDEWFNALLAAPDILAAAKCVVGRVLDELPPERATGESATADPAALEALAWKRFLRLANSAFRRSHMGLGAVVGYAGIRRVEVANLITLSEGIRAGMEPEKLRARLIPRTDLEVAGV